MFKSLQQHPPGGWRFYQPEIDWPKNPAELRGLGLESVVDKIITKRRANPRFNLTTNRDEVRREVLIFTEAIVRKMKGGSAWLIDGDPPQPKPESFPVRSFRRVAEAASSIKRAMAGVGLLVDWLGDGMEPVAIEIAESRAKVCATSGPDGSLCPFNRPSHGLQTVTSIAANDIKLLMEARADMKLATTHDAKLETCQICDCNLKLKCLSPMEHLKRKTPPEMQARFATEWPACWMNRD